MTFLGLTIVTSCRRYGKYLQDWAASIIGQTVKPGHVIILTHGHDGDIDYGREAKIMLERAKISVFHEHVSQLLDFGVARNRAVTLSRTEWVMHLDADDTLLPHAVADFQRIAPTADVISCGYMRTGQVVGGLTKKPRLYQVADGEAALQLSAICSGVSPFRRALWEQVPYRVDMLGAWDTALWIGFARLGARFRPTERAVFNYNQHPDSIFNMRRRKLGWNRVRTTAQLKHLRRAPTGVAIIVPRDRKSTEDRERIWARVRAHYETHHPLWPVIEGRCASAVWAKGAAILDALSRCTADVIVIADADCIVDPRALVHNVCMVAGGSAWGMPHQQVFRANAEMTQQICDEGPTHVPSAPPLHMLARVPHEGAPGGGIVVIRRVWYDAIGGIPLAFRGWGSEDRALACLASTLLGPCERGDAELVHLYHAPQAMGQQPKSNLQLLRKLGSAALQGKDALVAVAYTMPNPGSSSVESAPWKRNVGTAKPAEPVDVQKIVERQSFLARRKRRRMP